MCGGRKNECNKNNNGVVTKRKKKRGNQGSDPP